MGVCYDYVNFTKCEYFAISALGGDYGKHGIGRNLASRAFELLLVRGRGAWAGDSIALVGDDDDPEWDKVSPYYRNITDDAAYLLWQWDGLSVIGSDVDFDPHLLRLFCRLAKSRADLKLETDLIVLLGNERYQHCASLPPD